MPIPEYTITKSENGMVRIHFKTAVTRAELGVYFSYQVFHQKETRIKATRFGRITDIECKAAHWIAYLHAVHEDPNRIQDFKNQIGYQDPQVEAPMEPIESEKPVTS